ncbi:hypothetical protein [Paracoccus xiamenensis]|uniref:hypothetical protein n=1 Tax=Paracoccus xiamenensis TaxID=2714901 RepID=UPI00140D8A6F|nr:hypothetical protein [Paracoccus xiamenensis]NHF73122.1 hypothetical protein [Paracoccus xiamenensis]
MTEGFRDCWFFFACKRHPNTLFHFQDRFGLTVPPAHFEVMDSACEKILFSTSDLAELTPWLDANPESYFNLYLQDSQSQSFMFCHRPGNHHVLGIPYELLNEDELLFVLKRFGAIYGWGWHDDTPPDTIDEMRLSANAPHSILRRYRKGRLVPAN